MYHNIYVVDGISTFLLWSSVHTAWQCQNQCGKQAGGVLKSSHQHCKLLKIVLKHKYLRDVEFELKGFLTHTLHPLLQLITVTESPVINNGRY